MAKPTSVTESSDQLAERAMHWRQVWPQIGTMIPNGVPVLFLWITTGTWRRTATIWKIWRSYAWLPLRITTTRALVNPRDGRWHPGHPLRCAPDGTISAVWRDEAGRARALIPWLLDEPQLR